MGSAQTLVAEDTWNGPEYKVVPQAAGQPQEESLCPIWGRKLPINDKRVFGGRGKGEGSR